MTRLALLIALVSGAGAWAQQLVPEREVEVSRTLYENGKYAEALKRANDAMELSNFTDAQRTTLHELAALSAFNLGELKVAQRHFLQLLQLDPDHQLDPFAVAPPAIKAFEQVRRDNADALNLVRQQLALRAEQARREVTERERLLKEQEERRRRVEELARTVTVRTIEKRPFLVNFIPFGAGQFQEGRVGPGVAFAVIEAVMGITSIISYFAINALYEDYTITLNDRINPDGTNTYVAQVKRIPDSRKTEYQVWSALKYSTGGVFYLGWALGVVDAIFHHQAEITVETQQQLAPPTAPAGPKVQLDLFPTPGGLGGGLTIGF